MPQLLQTIITYQICYRRTLDFFSFNYFGRFAIEFPRLKKTLFETLLIFNSLLMAKLRLPFLFTWYDSFKK